MWELMVDWRQGANHKKGVTILRSKEMVLEASAGEEIKG